jgi:predicted dehydrogenase
MTSSGTSSRSVAERFGFDFCTSDEKDILGNDDINAVFIATRHDSHANFVIKAIEAGKNVFVEKPLCLTEAQLNTIAETYNTKYNSPKPFPLLMVGFNRRFAPLSKKLKLAVGEGPMAMIFRINAGSIPADSWIQDPEIGGGRVIGEVCHFVDYLTFLNGSLPVSVHATAMADPLHLNDVLNISLAFRNGSIGTISYFANGDKSLAKERLEVFAHGCTAVLDDFKSLTTYASGRKTVKKRLNQDKGQKDEVHAFIQAVLDGGASPISWEEIYSTSIVSFNILESVRTGSCIRF